MKRLAKQVFVLSLSIGLMSVDAQADLGDVRVNAFGTLSVASMHGEADSTRYGLNSEYKADETIESVSRGAVQFGYDLTENLSATLQLIADRGREANGIEVNVDWAFLAYQIVDKVTVRGGQLRLPVFMLSETIDVGYSYPWVRPPQTYYQMVPFSSYYGADILWTVSLGDGDLMIQPFVGRVEEQDINYLGNKETDLDAENGYGLNLVYNFDYGAIRAGIYDVEGSVTFNRGALASAAIQNSDVTFYSIGYNLDIGNWITIAEASWLDSQSGTGIAFPVDQVPEEDAMYLMVGHRFGSFLPHITYAQNSTLDTYVTGSGEQQSLIVGLRYDWKPGVAIKFEFEDIETSNGYNGDFFGPDIVAPNLGNRDVEIFTIAIDYVL